MVTVDKEATANIIEATIQFYELLAHSGTANRSKVRSAGAANHNRSSKDVAAKNVASSRTKIYRRL